VDAGGVFLQMGKTFCQGGLGRGPSPFKKRMSKKLKHCKNVAAPKSKAQTKGGGRNDKYR